MTKILFVLGAALCLSVACRAPASGVLPFAWVKPHGLSGVEWHELDQSYRWVSAGTELGGKGVIGSGEEARDAVLGWLAQYVAEPDSRSCYELYLSDEDWREGHYSCIVGVRQVAFGKLTNAVSTVWVERGTIVSAHVSIARLLVDGVVGAKVSKDEALGIARAYFLDQGVGGDRLTTVCDPAYCWLQYTYLAKLAGRRDLKRFVPLWMIAGGVVAVNGEDGAVIVLE